MSALTDLLHKVVTMLPFHSEQLQQDAHDVVEKIDEEIQGIASKVDAVAQKVENFVQPAGIKTPSDLIEVHGTDQNTPESTPETPES